MKIKTTIFISLCILLNFSFTVKEPKNDLELNSLNGKIKSIRIITYVGKTKNIAPSSQHYIVTHYNDLTIFNRYGNIDTIIFYSSISNKITLEVYKYNSHQKLLKKQVFKPINKLFYTTEYEYLNDTILSRVTESNSIFKSKDSKVYYYNSQNLIDYVIYYESKNKVYCKESYKYDNKNLIINYNRVYENSSITDNITNTYDYKGRLTSTSNSNGGGIDKRSYDSLNCIYFERNYPNNIQVKSYTERYEYTYDKHNNWITMITYNEKNEVKFTTKRTIIYYE